VHDGVFFEDHGIPTATVISSEFVRAASARTSSRVSGWIGCCTITVR
jgi:hypothetical protein